MDSIAHSQPQASEFHCVQGSYIASGLLQLIQVFVLAPYLVQYISTVHIICAKCAKVWNIKMPITRFYVIATALQVCYRPNSGHL